jgi:trimethylamine---corrinoid protein Co-methyltransferase
MSRTETPRRRRDRPAIIGPDNRHLRHGFAAQPGFSDDEIEAMHQTALRVLQELGIRVLLDEGRAILRAGGALVDEASQMVRISADMVAAALASAPRSFRLHAANPDRAQIFEPGALLFMAGAGCPNVTDRQRGRRPGSLESFVETLRLQQSFDEIHMHGPSAEPQDLPVAQRHYAIMQAQMTNCDKPLFVYARGRGQVDEAFQMIRLAYGLSDADFAGGVWATTVINTNSPRQIDIPMARGIIDFARAGQLSLITPFCLAGAMAPVTMAGALVLQHAEALAGITLAQLAKPGAPVAYGGFSSNVDMKSGAPSFGTPEHIRANLGSGQLARFTGLPWRSATGAASNAPDAQGASETVMALWAALLAQATVTVHAAGWLEGGLSFGYEKFILDVENLRIMAELTRPAPADTAALAFDAIAEVAPGGHFFAAAHTMDRYQTAFYAPLVADLSNYGLWRENGGQTADQRATAIWQSALADFVPPAATQGVAERLEGFVADRVQAGGIAPED